MGVGDSELSGVAAGVCGAGGADGEGCADGGGGDSSCWLREAEDVREELEGSWGETRGVGVEARGRDGVLPVSASTLGGAAPVWARFWRGGGLGIKSLPHLQGFLHPA